MVAGESCKCPVGPEFCCCRLHLNQQILTVFFIAKPAQIFTGALTAFKWWEEEGFQLNPYIGEVAES
jgi:hypothetical protein